MIRILFAILSLLPFSISLHSNEKANFDFSKVQGVVIDHSPASLKCFVGSPSICILPDGSYLASHDWFCKKGGNRKMPPVFKSFDKGKTWEQISELPFGAATLFVHKGFVFAMNACRISISEDGGKTWSRPKDDKSGIILPEHKAIAYYHTGPVPVICAKGRVWRAIEYLAKGRKWGEYTVALLSAPENSNLLEAKNWTLSNPIDFPEELKCRVMSGWLEGNVVHRRSDDKIVDILRVHSNIDDIAAVVEFDKRGIVPSFDKNKNFVRLPGACKKFTMRYDEISKKYYALTNWTPEEYRDRPNNAGHSHKAERSRHTVALVSSSDFDIWKVEKVLLSEPSDPEHNAFQYLDWQFDGEDIIAVSRTAAFDGAEKADNQHNANFFTFHRFKDFRK